jgi:hypothetical protein
VASVSRYTLGALFTELSARRALFSEVRLSLVTVSTRHLALVEAPL